MKTIISLLAWILWAKLAIGQEWMIRQSFESTDQKAEPAAFLATFPNDKPISTLIDGGFGYQQMLALNRLFVRGSLEYHRNTLIEKPQNSLLAGAGVEWYLRPAASPFNLILNSDLKYVRDEEENKGSFVWTGELAPFAVLLNAPKSFLNNSLRLFPSLSAGYEYQNVFDAPAATRDSLTGDVLRAVMKGKISVKFLEVPAGGLVGKPVLEIYADGALRYDVFNSTRNLSGWHPMVDTGLLLFPTGKEDLAIGINYVGGENPLKGLSRQKYWLFAIRIKI